MSIAWMSKLFIRSSTLQEKLPASVERRASSYLESLASTDADTLLEDDTTTTIIQARRRPAVDARIISDAIIGLSDGLTVPFALTAGLSALGDTRLVLLGGVAELVAGAISMGLGGYLGAKSEEESYQATLAATQSSVASCPSDALSSLQDLFAPFDLPRNLTAELTLHLSKSPHTVPFLMQFQHTMPEPASSRAVICALTIACGYFFGGFIPLLPYFLVARSDVLLALGWSLGVMALALFIFGYGKTCFVTGWRGSGNVKAGLKGGFQMTAVGGLAAGIAMGVIRLFNVVASQ